MEQEEVLYVKTLGNQTNEIFFGIKEQDPEIEITIAHESQEAVCFVLRKDSKDKIDIKGLCDKILREDAISYKSYWQVNVGTRKVNPTNRKTIKPFIDKQEKFFIEKNNSNPTKTSSVNLAWKIL